jgi:PPK2 family polyphosphate:nucleotide phosphotransferase
MSGGVHELLVEPGSLPRLRDRDPDARPGAAGKREGLEQLAELTSRLAVLHDRLFAEETRSLLLVLQGMDTAGKDGTIRHILTGVNPQGCHIVAFREPSATELAHDFLWRIHANCPARGELGIFNRSHYEDVVAVRVRNLAPEDVWRPRYEHIRSFEKMLVDEGTAVVKVFLHVSHDEQRRRLQERVDDPVKRWKLRRSDLDDRGLWDEFVDAYEEAIAETSTTWAPWHVVPADHNWARNLAVAGIVVDALERLDPKLPEPETGLEGTIVP